jgi:uracil phosphoribosyltransferase
MQIHHLSEKNSVLNHFLGQIRDISIQNDSLRFRKNMERIGEVMAYEMSKHLDYQAITIATPLGTKATHYIHNSLVICSILRAGLTLHNGFLNYFDAAENGFVSAYRHHPNQDDFFEIIVQYQAVADINNKTVVVVDPMLATGQSLLAVFKELMKRGIPAEVHIAVVIAAPEGIAFLAKELPHNCHLWIASIDEKLNEHSYIVPGIGDAGDLAYGEKL